MSNPELSEAYEDHLRSLGDHHVLWEWEHSEDRTYWTWVETVAEEEAAEEAQAEEEALYLAEVEAETYAEFGMSWVHGGGRAADVPAAWRQHRQST
jgi:hypothetical protein